MTGTQFFKKTNTPTFMSHSNPIHHRLKQPPSSPAIHYNQIRNNIPSSPSNTSCTKQIHTTLTENYLRRRPPNNILNKHPPEIASELNSLPKTSQSSLAKIKLWPPPKLTIL